MFNFNLLRDEFHEDEGITYEFKFLTDKEAEYIDEKHFWIPVKEALKWKEATDYIAYATSKNYLSNAIFIKNLTLILILLS